MENNVLKTKNTVAIVAVCVTICTVIVGFLVSRDAQFNIGISGDASNWYLNGQVDDVEFFSRALSSTEISNIYTNNFRRFKGNGIIRR